MSTAVRSPTQSPSDGSSGRARHGAHRLIRNMGVTTIGAILSNLASIVSLPIVVHRLGLVAYGTWAIGGLLITYAGTLLTALAPTIQRYAALASASRDRQALGRLFWTGLVSYTLLGGLLFAAAFLLAPTLVSLFAIPARYAASATTMTRILGGCAWVVIVSACINSFLAGLSRFALTALINVLTSVVYVTLVVLFLTRHGGIITLAVIVTVGSSVGLIVGILALIDVIAGTGPPRFSTRAEIRELARFSGRLQIVPVAMLINNQSDRLVLGLVTSARTVGAFAIGNQVAIAARVVGGALLGPICTSFTHSHVTDSRADLFARFQRVQSQWALLVLGSAAVLCAGLPGLLHAWLERPTGIASTFGILTIVAFAINLLTGPGTSYLRALGLPGLEARYSLETILANVVFTVGLALLVGGIGVVLGTLIAYAAMTARFFHMFDQRFPRAASGLIPAIVKGLAISGPVAVGCAFVTQLAASALPGLAALVVCVVTMMLALAAFTELSGLRSSLRALPARTSA